MGSDLAMNPFPEPTKFSEEELRRQHSRQTTVGRVDFGYYPLQHNDWRTRPNSLPYIPRYPTRFDLGQTCPKCGSWAFTQTYLPEHDKLRVRCGGCGYSGVMEPLDKRGS